MARFEDGRLVFQHGERVTWRQARIGKRQAEGIAAVVEHVDGDRVHVWIARQVRGRWQRERRVVRLRSIVPRAESAPIDDAPAFPSDGEATDEEGAPRPVAV